MYFYTHFFILTLHLSDLHKPEDYNTRVVDYVKKYATEEALNGSANGGAGDMGDDGDSESSMSEYGDDDGDEDFDMEM